MAEENMNRIPDDQAQDAILSGTFSPKADQEISVISPDGTPGTVQGSEIRDALRQGYQLETARQQAVREYVETQKKSPFAGPRVFGAQALDEALLGIPERVFDAKMNPFEVEKKNALKKEFDSWNTAGGLVGFAGSFFAPGASAVYKGATKLGQAAQSAVASKLAAAGVEKGSKSLAKSLLARTGELSARGATEGLVMTAPVAITEAALGNPEAAAEALMLGGGIGGAFGVAAGTGSTLFQKLKKFKRERIKIDPTKAQEDAFVNEIGERTAPDPMSMPEDDSLIAKLRAEGASADQIKYVQDNIQKFKPNSLEIKNAANELGLPVLEEQITSDRAIQDLADVLSRRPTVAGRLKGQEFSQRFDTYDQVIKASLGSVDERSTAEIGESVKRQLLEQADAVIRPQREIFQNLEAAYKEIPVEQKSLQRIAQNLSKTQLAIDPSVRPMVKFLLQTVGENRIKSLSDLKQLRTIINGMEKNSSNKIRFIMDASERLNNLEESVIDRAVQNRIKAAKGQPGLQTLIDVDQLQQSYSQMQQAKKNWRELMNNLAEEGDALSLGNIKNPGDFLEKLKDVPAEVLVKRLLPKNDVASLKILERQFPEQFKLITQFEKSKLLEGLLEDGRVSPRKFITKYKNLSKEVKQVLFSPDQMKKLDAVRVDLESLPRRVNPSGTSQAMDIISNFTSPVQATIDNVSSFGQMSRVRRSLSVEAILGTEKEIDRVRQRLNGIPERVEEALKKAKPVSDSIDARKSIDAINRLMNDDGTSKQEALKILQNEMMKNQSDPSAIYNRIQEDVDAISEGGAPNIASAFARRMQTAANYLYESFPKPLNAPNPFLKQDFKPSTTELGKFQRKLSVVLDPFAAIDALEDNTLTADHIEALVVNYPMLYGAMRSKLTDSLLEKQPEMSYQARLKMSLFLGLDVDNSLSPESIRTYQQAYGQPEANPEFAAANLDTGLRSNGLMKLGKDIDRMTETTYQRLQKGV